LAVHSERVRREADRANRGEAAAVAERERAEANYRAARAALRQMLGRLDARRSTDIPALRELQRAQAEDALAFYLAVAAQEGDRPEVRYDAARAGVEAARLQARLGLPVELEANLRRACDQFAALAAEDPGNADYRAGWASALSNLGAHLRAAGRLDDAFRCHSEAVALQEALIATHPDVAEYRDDLATSHHGLGNIDYSRKRVDDGERHYRTAIDLRERLVQEQPHARDYRRRLAQTQLNLSVMLQVLPGRAGDAAIWHDRAEGHFEQLLRDDPKDFDSLSSLATLRLNWAYVLKEEGQVDKALADLAKNVAALTAALAKEPGEFPARDALHRTYGVRAQILDATKRYAESAAAWEQVVATSLPATQNVNRQYLAEALARAGAHGRALDVTEAATAALPEKPGWDHLYHLAGVCGLAAAAARADPALASDERDRSAARAAGLCVRLLGRIKETVTAEGWDELRQKLPRDARFDSLRDDPAFRRLQDGGG
jgi:tetratricopeptide (TPR) repeat protein